MKLVIQPRYLIASKFADNHKQNSNCSGIPGKTILNVEFLKF